MISSRYFSRLFSGHMRTRVHTTSPGRHVRRDWFLLLVGFVAVVAVALAVGVQFYVRVQTPAALDASGARGAGTQLLDQVLLREGLRVFDEKEDRFEELQRVKPSIPLP